MNPVLLSTLTMAAEKVVDGVGQLIQRPSATQAADRAQFERLLTAQKRSNPRVQRWNALGVQDRSSLESARNALRQQMEQALLQAGGALPLSLAAPTTPGGSWTLSGGGQTIELRPGSALATAASDLADADSLAGIWDKNPTLSLQEIVELTDIHA